MSLTTVASHRPLFPGVSGVSLAGGAPVPSVALAPAAWPDGGGVEGRAPAGGWPLVPDTAGERVVGRAAGSAAVSSWSQSLAVVRFHPKGERSCLLLRGPVPDCPPPITTLPLIVRRSPPCQCVTHRRIPPLPRRAPRQAPRYCMQSYRQTQVRSPDGRPTLQPLSTSPRPSPTQGGSKEATGSGGILHQCAPPAGARCCSKRAALPRVLRARS